MIVVSHTNVVLSFRDDDDEDEDDWYHLLEDTDDEEPLDEHHPPAAIGPPSPLDTRTIAMACVKQRHVTENEDGELMIAEYRKLPVDVPHTKDGIQYWNTFARISEDVYEDENHKYDVCELSQNSESFNKAKADSFKRFLDILRRHKYYRGLAAPIIDPDTEKGENLKVPKLFVALRGGYYSWQTWVVEFSLHDFLHESAHGWVQKGGARSPRPQVSLPAKHDRQSAQSHLFHPASQWSRDHAVGPQRGGLVPCLLGELVVGNRHRPF